MSSALPLTNQAAWKAFSGAAYSSARPSYAQGLYKVLLDHHSQTRGEMDNAVDLGCGPGTVTTQLAPSFRTVVGVDVASSMYEAAPSLPNVQYHTSIASSLPFIPSSSVDLVTAGTAAHWFDHPSWWTEMTRIVKPAGSVAVWTFTPGFMAASPPPGSPPYPAALTILLETTQRYSGPFLPYRSIGNHHTYSLYDEMPGPSAEEEGWSGPKRWKWGWKKGEGYLRDEGVWKWDALEPTEGEENVEMEDAMNLMMSLDELSSYYSSVSPVLAYRAALPPGAPDWLLEQIEKVKAEGGKGWEGSTRVNVRRVLSLVLWKKE